MGKVLGAGMAWSQMMGVFAIWHGFLLLMIFFIVPLTERERLHKSNDISFSLSFCPCFHVHFSHSNPPS